MHKILKTLGSSPTGILGRVAGVVMNIIHARQYAQIIEQYLLPHIKDLSAPSILDIGCGGGQTVRLFDKMLKNATITGLDHSPEMVSLSKKTNRQGFKAGRVDIVLGSVRSIPYSDVQFDMVTAFDTISFWGDIDASLNEILRVLKPGGFLSIINGYPQEGTPWWDFVRFKTDEEYRRVLSTHGFEGVTIKIQQQTIIIWAHT